MFELEVDRLPRAPAALDVPTFVCLNTIPRCDCPFCAHDPQEPNRPQSLTLTDLKPIMAPDYFLGRRSTTLILSGAEPTTQPELIAIVAHARGPFANIRLDTDGVKLADADRLNELISAGVSYFASPIYGPRRVHNFLTRPGYYDRTLSYMTNLVQALRGLPHVKLEIQLSLAPDNYEHHPAVAKQLLSRFGDAAIYSVNGPTRSSARMATDGVSLAAIGPHVSRTIELLLQAHVPLQLSAIPLCTIEQDVLVELLPALRQQTDQHPGCFYYIAPGQRGVQLCSPRVPRAKACLDCSLRELCGKCMATSVGHVRGDSEPALRRLH
jgi:MoaA/NifB/PqqE/SkfB family radical SAM enzyme